MGKENSKQVKAGATGTCEAPHRGRTSRKPTLKCTQKVELFSNGKVVKAVFHGA